jgi:hypothetical protein
MALMVAKVVPTAEAAEAPAAPAATALWAIAWFAKPPLATETTKAPAALKKSRRDVPLWATVASSDVLSFELKMLCMETPQAINVCARLMARKIETCVPQRHFKPSRAVLISASVAFGFFFKNAAEVMTQPVFQ